MKRAFISVYNQATSPGFNFDDLIHPLQNYINHHLEPAWGCPATLIKSDGPVAGTWGLVFMDNADEPGALAYHTVDGLPLAKVFVDTIINANESVSGGASHELVEMLVDPSCSMTVQDNDGIMYAYEAADPVEETLFPVSGFQMSNFVYPEYFQPFYTNAKLDACDVLKSGVGAASGSIAPGGYQSVYQNGAWTEIFGSKEKEDRFAKEDRRGHRSQYRRHHWQHR